MTFPAKWSPSPRQDGDPLDAVCLAANDQGITDNRPGTQVRNSLAVAAMRRELNLEFLHECCGGIRIHAELVQTFAEIGDVGGTCYALKQLFAHVKAAHPIFVELRDGLVAAEERAP